MGQGPRGPALDSKDEAAADRSQRGETARAATEALRLSSICSMRS